MPNPQLTRVGSKTGPKLKFKRSGFDFLSNDDAFTAVYDLLKFLGSDESSGEFWVNLF